jgi:hypothetical protein
VPRAPTHLFATTRTPPGRRSNSNCAGQQYSPSEPVVASPSPAVNAYSVCCCNRPQRGLEAMSAAFDYPLTAKARLSRSSRLGTHTRSIQAHFRATQSSPPCPLWFCIADMHSRSSKGLSRHTTPCDRVRAPIPPVTTPRFATGSRGKKKEPIGMLPDRDLGPLC